MALGGQEGQSCFYHTMQTNQQINYCNSRKLQKWMIGFCDWIFFEAYAWPVPHILSQPKVWEYVHIKNVDTHVEYTVALRGRLANI